MIFDIDLYVVELNSQKFWIRDTVKGIDVWSWIPTDSCGMRWSLVLLILQFLSPVKPTEDQARQKAECTK
jgi:hypothetical protein